MEDDTELCCRLIKIKTGVSVPIRDIIACHPLGKKGSNILLVRFGNRRPGSAWDVLANGMVTGRYKFTNANFTDANVYLNFQLTKAKSELVKKVRTAKFEKNIHKYGTDQNGRITLRVKNDSNWIEVSTDADLKELIAGK